MVRPIRIGISACFFHKDPQRPTFKGKTLLYAEQSIVHWVMAKNAVADVMAYMIPSVSEDSPIQLKHYAQDLDGLVLEGGSDVSPMSYGEEALRPEWSGDYVRDCYEIELLRAFAELKKPVLGVCRGAQLINVAYGGTLYQDIQTQLPEAQCHRNWDVYDGLFHKIVFEKNSGLSRLYPKSMAKTNTIHHQAIKTLGKGLVAEAYSEEDQIIEAIRLKAPNYVFAVQWHPEFHDVKEKTLLDGKPILQEFLTEAKKWRT